MNRNIAQLKLKLKLKSKSKSTGALVAVNDNHSRPYKEHISSCFCWARVDRAAPQQAQARHAHKSASPCVKLMPRGALHFTKRKEGTT